MSLIYPKESVDVFPKHLSPEYRSTVKRSPSKPLVIVPHTLSELTGPAFGHDAIQDTDNDLTKQHKGEPLGERIIVHGQVLDEDKRPIPETLVEIWQANACGRYVHIIDQHPAPLDPNFTGAGRTITDKNGYYKFITVKPGAYPWGNHHNAWRPNHIHFSVFGQSFLTRLVTQMYFPGDYLFPFDPIFNSVTDEKARQRMVSNFDLENTIPDWALCFRWNIVLRGREATPLDTDKHLMSDITPSQTVGPFFAYGLAPKGRCDWDPNGQYSWKETVGDNLITPDATGIKIHIEGHVLDGDGKPINDAMIEIWQADAQGRYTHARGEKPRPNAKFTGFGRSATDKNGIYSFDTIKPGAVPGPNGRPQAPHIVVCIFSRGMLRQIYTRLYFSDEKANDTDQILALVPADRRGTLIAHKQPGSGPATYRFDIRVQGGDETVFFDI